MTPRVKPHWRNPIHLAACGFGAGASPWAPGTAGTLVAVPLYLAVQDLPVLSYIALTLALFALGVWLCDRTARDLGVPDHPSIVWDEIVGYLVTLTAAPHGAAWWIAGFALFRLFDIWKPWPVRIADQRVHGGFGIMLDDVLAGLYGAGVLHVVVWVYG